MATPVNPYNVLGIDRTADPKTIRRAYRRRAKECHPDVGGSAAEFEAVNEAQLVLLDERRRAQFDRTGHYDDLEPDNEQAKILEMLSIVIDMALGIAQRRGQSPEHTDFIALMRTSISDGKAKHREEAATFREALKYWDKVVDRFSVNSGPNVIDQVVRGKVAQLHMMIATSDENIKALDGVAELIKGYKFRREEQPKVEADARTKSISMDEIFARRRSW